MLCTVGVTRVLCRDLDASECAVLKAFIGRDGLGQAIDKRAAQGTGSAVGGPGDDDGADGVKLHILAGQADDLAAANLICEGAFG